MEGVEGTCVIYGRLKIGSYFIVVFIGVLWDGVCSYRVGISNYSTVESEISKEG